MSESRRPLEGQVAVVTGGSGALGSAFASALAVAGARVGVLARDGGRLEATVESLRAGGGEALALRADVLDRQALEAARDGLLGAYGRVDLLVCAAGGNVPEATVAEDGSFFDLPEGALRAVLDLNVLGTMLSCQVFGGAMVPREETDTSSRSIVTVSSMAARRALSRVGAYGAAKAAVESFTRWLAADCARRYGDRLRVNAIAPGFFVGEQNRTLLLDDEGRPTRRGQAIIGHTPAARFGVADDLVSTLLWLCSPGSRFVTGVVVAVDGGFSASSGV